MQAMLWVRKVVFKISLEAQDADDRLREEQDVRDLELPDNDLFCVEWLDRVRFRAINLSSGFTEPIGSSA